MAEWAFLRKRAMRPKDPELGGIGRDCAADCRAVEDFLGAQSSAI